MTSFEVIDGATHAKEVHMVVGALTSRLLPGRDTAGAEILAANVHKERGAEVDFGGNPRLEGACFHNIQMIFEAMSLPCSRLS